MSIKFETMEYYTHYSLLCIKRFIVLIQKNWNGHPFSVDDYLNVIKQYLCGEITAIQLKDFSMTSQLLGARYIRDSIEYYVDSMESGFYSLFLLAISRVYYAICNCIVSILRDDYKKEDYGTSVGEFIIESIVDLNNKGAEIQEDVAVEKEYQKNQYLELYEIEKKLIRLINQLTRDAVELPVNCGEFNILL